MKPGQTDKLIEAFACLYRPTPPMTPEELAAFRSQIAAQMAEDERRRQPEPQLPLPVAA